jgi:SH3-like domain-containing protein
VRAETVPFTGEVNDRQVNVRSGPSTNYYVVVRLAAGARVQVVAEESGWYGIVPPEGCYSLVSKEFVETAPDGTGTINGANVRVRAGSDLDSHRYAVQVKLSKGSAVRVLGEADEGFLKIAPPDGARVWVHSDYIVRVPEDGSAPVAQPIARTASAASAPPVGDPAVTTPEEGATQAPPTEAVPSEPAPEATQPVADAGAPQDAAPSEPAPTTTAETPTTAPEVTTPAVVETPKAKTETVSKTTPAIPTSRNTVAPKSDVTPSVVTREPDPSVLAPPTPAAQQTTTNSTLRGKLQDADAAFKAEMTKPEGERNYDPLIDMYAPLVTQEEDKVAKIIAERRIAQINSNRTATTVLREIQIVRDDAARDRTEFADAREKMKKPLRTAADGFEAQGELRESLVFDTANGPRRYRLVDPSLTVPRTMCYLEIPTTLGLDVNGYLGRVVAIKASEKFLETGDVNPIPVIVVSEIVLGTPETLARVIGDLKPMSGPPASGGLSSIAEPAIAVPAPSIAAPASSKASNESQSSAVASAAPTAPAPQAVTGSTGTSSTGKCTTGKCDRPMPHSHDGPQIGVMTPVQ